MSARGIRMFAIGAATIGIACAAVAQPGGGGSPDLSESVLRLIEAPYLTEEERADARVFHGVWLESDLEDPALRARAALMVGAVDDWSLSHEDAAPEDRAEARLIRGDMEGALETLTGVQSVRGQRIRAEALEWLGRFDEADAAIDPIVRRLERRQSESAEQIVEGVRALAIRARLRGNPAQDYHLMMQLLSRARSEIDRMYWPASLAEAELLMAKDNRQEAMQALADVARLNPAVAKSWRMRGDAAVDSFNFDAARETADHLDRLLGRVSEEEGASSLYGDLILTRAWLRQRDPDLAEEELAPALERFPAQREATALHAAIEAVRYDFTRARELLDRFDERSPGSPYGLYVVGEALAKTRQYEEAATFLEEAAERQENWPPPMVELGLLELQSGRDANALKALRRVAELDPFHKRAANSLELIEELLTYDTVESEHFIVRFRPGVDRVMAEDMLGPLENIHEIVTTALDHEPDRKTVIELMPDHEWFAVRITGMPAIHTIAAATGPVIAMEAPKIGPRHSGEYDWIRVIRHEYVHTVSLSRTLNRIPHWFTEAAAVYLEGSVRGYGTCRLLVNALKNDELFDMEEINIAFVRPKKPTDRSQAYAQGHWMYEYMVERFGERAPLELMDMYAQGLREETAIPSVLGVERQTFYEDFVEWARADAKTWGFLTSPSVDELRLETAMESPKGRSAIEQGLSDMAMEAGLATSGIGRGVRSEIPLPTPHEPDVDAWLAEHPDHPDLLGLKIGFIMRDAEGRLAPDVAVPYLERYAAARPVDPNPHRELLKRLLSEDTRAAKRAAIPHLEYLDAREQKSPTFAVELARIHAGFGEWDRAAAFAERATQIAPFDASLRELAATIELKRGGVQEAARHISALTRLEPDRDIHRKRLEAIERMIGPDGA